MADSLRSLCAFHDWLYMSVIDGTQVVKCRSCGKWDSFKQRGFATTYPAGTYGKSKADAVAA